MQKKIEKKCFVFEIMASELAALNFFIQSVKDMNFNMAIVLISFFKVDIIIYLDISLTMTETIFL